ncbi:MAG: dockerin type I domain-containing protein [Candidatus Latescibacterota bacterium]
MMKYYCIIILLFFLVIQNLQADTLMNGVRHKQAIPARIILVGSLDMGLQTGVMSNNIHSLSVGLFSQSQLSKIPADFNGDGVVNFSDFIIFANGFGHRQSDAGYNVALDLNGDGEVGFSDFLLFAAAFTG